MCGIVGFTSDKPELEKIKQLTSSLSHRGPDQEDYKVIEIGKMFLHLGSARLVIRGSEQDSMPMSNESDSYIIYNGEIFDLKSLKSKTSNPPDSSNDTIHLLNFLCENKNKLNEINGMFSFAFYDSKEDSLILARDKLGIKPLYFTVNIDGHIAFSSEMKNLSDFSNLKITSENEINNTLLYNGQRMQSNIVRNLFQLKPGHYLEFSSSKEIKNQKYYATTNNLRIKNEKFENLMVEVLEDHLDADTDVDMFLSGGVDSSIIAFLTKKKLNKNIRHFSVSFEDETFNEKKSFDDISNYLNLDPQIFKFKESEISDLVEEALNNMNSLVLDPSFVPTYFLCKNTANYTKAVISGDGADELFGGYEWYRANKIKNLFPSSLFKSISKTQLANFTSKSESYLSILQKYQYFFKGIDKNNLVQLLIWQSPKLKFIDSDIHSFEEYIEDLSLNENDVQKRMQELDLNTYMYANILQKIDIAGMANGLEIRPPFLDDRIINFSRSLDSKDYVGFKRTKLFLREYMYNNKIPNFDKPKHGFAFPIKKWLDQSGKNRILNELSRDSIYKELFDNYGNGINIQNPNSNEIRLIWALYVLGFWYEKNELVID